LSRSSNGGRGLTLRRMPSPRCGAVSPGKRDHRPLPRKATGRTRRRHPGLADSPVDRKVVPRLCDNRRPPQVNRHNAGFHQVETGEEAADLPMSTQGQARPPGRTPPDRQESGAFASAGTSGARLASTSPSSVRPAARFAASIPEARLTRARSEAPRHRSGS
jgi:hypothetical protein